ncbi:hypothetical protein RIR_jg10433.t1 [Rhizophagus irregularis DAOM 181602=DAOM 197198]|nr:hypothetical protein RIR_jg10433.t1 [Rhizophagus irregularis DAOM 181602=DAOM 197198]
MDAAMEQTIGFQGRTLRWGSSNDSKALCHDVPVQQRTPRNNSRSRSRSKSRDRSASAQRSNSNSNSSNTNGINPPSVPVINSEPDRMEEDLRNTGTLIHIPMLPSSSDELNSVIQDQKAIKDTLQSLTGSIQGFIASLGGSPSDRASAPSQ